MKIRYRLPRLPGQRKLEEQDLALVAFIQTGLPICATPYAELAKKLEMDETEVISRLLQLTQSNVIKRFGIVVRHFELGYRANAMTVWDVPDENVNELGSCLGQFDFVTLCYRRPRRLPQWPYNLFTMIHGQNRENVLENINFLITRCKLENLKHEVLFSSRRFKQRGAIYHNYNTLRN